MSSWRCPHCRVAQPETSRCWVCQRSTTSCDACRHYRRAVALGLGFCGLDRRRVPLLGDEMRACWEAVAGAAAHDESTDDDARSVTADLVITRRPALAFVEVAPGSRGGAAVMEREAAPPDQIAAPIVEHSVAHGAPLATGWTLWGDAFL